MQLCIFNKETLKKYSPNIYSKLEKISKLITDIFEEEKKFKINVIFTSKKEIQELNNQYRYRDSVTDVLSFNIDEEDFMGEIYICPEYVLDTYGSGKPQEKLDIEIVRLLVHGILHLLGHDHEEEFEEEDKNTEVMFVKQEEILENVLKQIN